MGRRIVHGFALACLVAFNCRAQPYFFRKDIPAGQFPHEVFVGDFNGDGRPDLAVYSFSRFSILFNTGGGNFGRPIEAQIAFSSSPLFAVAVDVNGDGRQDLVTKEGVFLSRGDGTFQRAGAYQQIVAAADFNSDGKVDLLISDFNRGTSVWLGNGDGTFRAGAALTSQFVLSAVVADLNRDGRSDIVCVLEGPPSVFLGKSDGTFAPGIDIVTSGGDPQLSIRPYIYVADFNGDGLLDVALPEGVLLGKGDGTFQPTLIPYPWSGKVSFPHIPLLYAAVDFTGDGKPDLVVGDTATTNLISVYPGRGDGTFSAPLDQTIGWGSGSPLDSAAAVADLDGDGRLDLVAVNSISQTLSVLFAKAQGGPPLRRAVSTASGTAIVAPQSLATLLAPTPVTVSTSAPPPMPGSPAVWPTSLGGTGLNVRDSAGVTRPAPLLFVSPAQINFQVPAGTALGEASLSIVIVDSRATTEVGSMQVDAVAPGLFTLFPGSLIPAATAMLVLSDGTQIPLPVYTCAPTPQGISCNWATIPLSIRGGTVYVTFYGTGFHDVSPNDVVITEDITEVTVPVLYVGSPVTPGLDQINVRLTPDLSNEFGFLELRIRVRGIDTNSVALLVQ